MAVHDRPDTLAEAVAGTRAHIDAFIAACAAVHPSSVGSIEDDASGYQPGERGSTPRRRSIINVDVCRGQSLRVAAIIGRAVARMFDGQA